MKHKLIATIFGLLLVPLLAHAQVTSNFWKVLSAVLQPSISTWQLYSPGDFRFDGEILPDGALCAVGDILKKAGVSDWDCVPDSGTTGKSKWATTTDASTISPAGATGIIVGRATSTSATTTNLAITALTSELLKVDGTGVVREATAGADYEVPVTAGDGLTRTVNDFDCDTASGAVFGCLTAVDWTTFNDKLGFYDAWTHPSVGISATTSSILINSATSTITNLTSVTSTSTNATTTGIHYVGGQLNGINEKFTNATTTNATTTNQTISSLSSAIVTVDALGITKEYAGTTCTNQFIRALSALGVATCESVSLTADITGTLPVVNGGTGQTAFRQGWLHSDGTTITASSSPTVNYIVATSTTGSNIFAGKVGIGTTTPSSKLNVYGDTNTSLGILSVRSSDSDNTGITLMPRYTGANDNTRAWQIAANYNAYGNLDILRSTGSSTNPTTQTMSMTKDGYVGIGTTSPYYSLDVAGYVATDIFSGFKQGRDTVLYASSLNGSVAVGAYNAASWISATSTVRYATVMGYGAAAASPDTGSFVTAIGAFALSNNRASDNTAVGGNTLRYNTTGRRNTGVGNYALFGSTTAGITGSNNIAVGHFALRGLATGDHNVALGYVAGNGGGTDNENSVYDSYMTFLGSRATRDSSIASTTALTNGIAIGYNAKVLASNQAVLGNDSITTTLLKGNVGIGTSSPSFQLDIEETTATVVPLRIVAATSRSGIRYDSYSTNAFSRNWLMGSNINMWGDYAFTTSATNGGDPTAGYIRMQIDSSGNVGFGTTTTVALQGLLSASSTSKTTAVFNQQGTGKMIDLLAAGVSKFSVDNLGRVGIGTTTPVSLLHVSSGASATTTVNFGELGNTTSDACFNTKNVAGGDISFYFIGTTMVVENNPCR